MVAVVGAHKDTNEVIRYTGLDTEVEHWLDEKRVSTHEKSHKKHSESVKSVEITNQTHKLPTHPKYEN